MGLVWSRVEGSGLEGFRVAAGFGLQRGSSAWISELESHPRLRENLGRLWGL